MFVGEIALPVPFTIISLIFSIGIAISSCLKGADKTGKE